MIPCCAADGRRRGGMPAGQIFQKGAHTMYKNYDELPSVLSVKELKEFLGISRAGAYQLLHREDFPTLHIASRLLVAKDKLLEWMEQNTGGLNGIH